MPRVSVLIPTFNCCQFLGRSLDSVFAQTYKDYEVIVVDDGSTDDTQKVVDRYGSKVLYTYQSNCGLSLARNATLAKSSGELIAYLDADDVWYEHKLEKGVAFLDAHSKCGMVHSEVTIIDDEDRVIHSRFNRETGRPVPQGHCVMDLLNRCHIQVPTVLERRLCVDAAGLFDDSLIVAQDYYHWIMIALEGWAFGYIDEPLAKYRWRAGSLMSSKRRVLEDQARMFGTLLPQASVDHALSDAARLIVHDRFVSAERELAYLDRLEGRHQDAKRRLMGLIRRSPFDVGLYVALVKSYVSGAKTGRGRAPTIAKSQANTKDAHT